MITVIAEKPSVAKDLATYLNYHSKHNGYFESSDYYITYAYGHLVGLSAPDKYGYGFDIKSLPMIPHTFTLDVVQESVSGKKQPSKSALAQLKVIKTLFDKSQSIIVATDAGREGELIFRNIYDYLKCRLPFKRLWISSLTQKAIAEGFDNLKEGRGYDPLYHSARARAEADWLLGMNATTAITMAGGKKRLLSLGRVQTPTLSLIAQRYIDNKDFKAEPYWLLQGTFEHSGITFKARSGQLKDRGVAQGYLSHQGQTFTAKKVERKETSENAPLLHDLSSLQQLANRLFGYSADDTLKTMQELYEAKFITYPRTGSRYIPLDIYEEMPGLLRSVAAANPVNGTADYITKNLSGTPLNKRSVNDAKVTDHHAVIVTDQVPALDKLTEKQTQIYLLVLRRLLEALSPAVIKDRTVIVLSRGDLDLKASGFVITKAGWTAAGDIFGKDKDEEKEDEDNPESTAPLPMIVEGSETINRELVILDKLTKPKPIHTEASLLKAMELAGEEQEDDEIRESMKGKGIGTPATRASIIETLFSRKYIVRDKKKLVPTDIGLYLYGKVKDLKLAEVKLTGLWEQKLLDIESGRITKDVFDLNIKKFTESSTADLLALDMGQMPIEDSGKEQLICPKCKNNILIIKDKKVFCKGFFDKSCIFGIFREISGYNLPEKQVKALIQNGRTGTITKFVSAKTGNTFSAKVELTDNFKTKFLFENKNKPKKGN